MSLFRKRYSYKANFPNLVDHQGRRVGMILEQNPDKVITALEDCANYGTFWQIDATYEESDSWEEGGAKSTSVHERDPIYQYHKDVMVLAFFLNWARGKTYKTNYIECNFLSKFEREPIISWGAGESLLGEGTGRRKATDPSIRGYTNNHNTYIEIKLLATNDIVFKARDDNYTSGEIFYPGRWLNHLAAEAEKCLLILDQLTKEENIKRKMTASKNRQNEALEAKRLAEIRKNEKDKAKRIAQTKCSP